MRIPTLCISLLALALCVAAASLSARRVQAASTGQALTRRQVSVGLQAPVPSQCTPTCSPVTNEVSLGCPVTACCTTTFETQYYNCLECIGMALDAANYTTAQNDLNLLYTTCVDIGFVLPPLALPGQPASGSSSSSRTPATGAANGASWRDARADALIGAAALLALMGLW